MAVPEPTKQEFAEDWRVFLRVCWNSNTGLYTFPGEQSFDAKVWEPFAFKHHVKSLEYIGGPKDGKVETE